MARPSTAARVAAFRTGVVDTIGFLTACLLFASIVVAHALCCSVRLPLIGGGRKNSPKAILPPAPVTEPPCPALAEPETTKGCTATVTEKPAPAVGWGDGPCLVTDRP